MDSSCNRSNFATVLVAREASDAPSELELHLRRCSRKIKVVPSLTGGAHILFPTAGTTLAVRVYDPFGIAKLEKEYSGLIQQSIRSRINIFAHQKDDATSGGNDRSVEIENDFDGICSFRNSFKHSVVFFALTNASLLSDQLSRFGSIVNSLQRCLAETCEFHTGCNNLEKKGNARVFVVQNIGSIPQTLLTTLSALNKDKIALKERFFLGAVERNFLPDSNGKINSDQAALKLVNAFRSWCRRIELSVDDANVIMDVMGSFENILNADKSMLDDIPIDSSMKSKILQFFSNKEYKKSYSNESQFPGTSDEGYIHQQSQSMGIPTRPLIDHQEAHNFKTNVAQHQHLSQPGQYQIAQANNYHRPLMTSNNYVDSMEQPLDYSWRDPIQHSASTYNRLRQPCSGERANYKSRKPVPTGKYYIDNTMMKSQHDYTVCPRNSNGVHRQHVGRNQYHSTQRTFSQPQPFPSNVKSRLQQHASFQNGFNNLPPYHNNNNNNDNINSSNWKISHGY